MKKPINLKALLIDFDGTLVDSIEILWQIYVKFLEKHGAKATKEEFTWLMGPSLTEIVSTLKKNYHLNDPLDELIAEYQNLAAEKYASLPSLFPDAALTLNKAKQLGLKTALVTTAPLALVSSVLERLKVLSLFDAVICKEPKEASKPEPALYIRALKTLKIKPNEAIAIEDALSGIESAVRANIFTIQLRHQKRESETERLTSPAQLTVDSWGAILEFIEKSK